MKQALFAVVPAEEPGSIDLTVRQAFAVEPLDPG
jgi:hypothetical protein